MGVGLGIRVRSATADTQTAAPVAVAGPNDVTAMAGGLVTGYALRSDGTVWAWGFGYVGQLGNGGAPTTVRCRYGCPD